jgi:DNA-directed RNA polymerase subunit F
MIKSAKAISIAEAKEFVSEDNTEMKGFMKSFSTLSAEEGKEMREKLLGLDMIKLNEKHISKVIDILPSDKDELTKIMSDVAVSEDEANKILDIVKEYK